jgi:hypothetical protein
MAAQPLNAGSSRGGVGDPILRGADGAKVERSALSMAAAVDPSDFEAAAAQVEHKALRQGGAIGGGQVSVVGLLGPAEDLDRDAGLTSNALNESPAVFGFTHGAGGRCYDVNDPRRIAKVAIELEDFHRLVHGLGGEFPGCPQTVDKPDGFAHLVGDVEVTTGHVGDDDQPKAVGADVDDADFSRSFDGRAPEKRMKDEGRIGAFILRPSSFLPSFILSRPS